MDIREVPTVLLHFAAFVLTSSGQPSTTQASLPPPEIPKGLSKVGDQGQRVEAAKGKGASQDGPRLEDKGKGKKVKPLPEAKGIEAALKTKDATSKAKDGNPKSKEADPKDNHP
nr:hypothetical protein CFP56_20105 [Quercus suber]